jgi:type I restriction enzyme S subunit
MKNGWEIRRLPEIAEYFIGLTYSPKDVSNKGTIVLRSSNIQNDELDLSDLVRVARPVKEGLIVRKGDILMCSRNGSKRLVGKTALIGNLPEEMTFGTFMTVIRGKPNPYLAWFFKSDAFREQIGVGENTMINQITKYMLDAIRVPFPPLAEQQRIVGLLDEAFAGLATATANAAKNLQNARDLFESHLQSVFTQDGKGWIQHRLMSITTKIGSGATPRGGGESYKLEGISLIRSLNVHDLGFRYPKLAFLDDAQASELSNVEVQPGDVLLNITGASVARCCVVPEDVLPARVNQHVSIIRPIGDRLDPDFLHYLLISKPYKDQLLQTGEEGGSTRQAITKAQIQDFSVRYPATIKEQETFVAKLDAMLGETNRLAHLYERKLAALEALKKSLLNQAFAGKL